MISKKSNPNSMKRSCFTLLAYFLSLSVSAQNNQVVVSNGRWNNNSTWALGHAPTNGEVAIVPADSTVVVDANIQLSTPITLKIYGTLYFQTGKLRLTGSSAVYVYPGGTVASEQGNASDKIEIDGVTKYSGDAGTLSGPLMANSATTGFETMPIILPVKFVAYNISYSNEKIAINWSTTDEENAGYYEVERSENGYTWQTIGRVAAKGERGVISNYFYTDKNNINRRVYYYRIKQVDEGEHFTYSSIKSIKPDLPSIFDMKVSSFSNNIVVDFSQQLRGNAVVRLTTPAGQTIAERTYCQPGSHLSFKQGSLRGHYIISIATSDGINIGRHIFLD